MHILQHVVVNRGNCKIQNINNQVKHRDSHFKGRTNNFKGGIVTCAAVTHGSLIGSCSDCFTDDKAEWIRLYAQRLRFVQQGLPPRNLTFLTVHQLLRKICLIASAYDDLLLALGVADIIRPGGLTCSTSLTTVDLDRTALGTIDLAGTITAANSDGRKDGALISRRQQARTRNPAIGLQGFSMQLFQPVWEAVDCWLSPQMT
ncbi:hypothetical protein CLF_104415 [Clonorchis sinensis]|uniref:Uncharacterized protein n=1 Tax=Clonorchis sinensis TaxID=79923 RepID=G7YBM2_CLOSI|nr:hypothetical protein CLF_104415 [Clonorchis sinensis]